MKHSFLKLSIVLCALFLWAGISMATSTGILVGNSSILAEYLDTIPTEDQPNGNNASKDNEYNVNALVDLYNANTDPDLPINLTSLGKWEVDENEWEDNYNPYGFTISFGDKNTSGTWSASNWVTGNSLYYSLKAGSYNANKPNKMVGLQLWYTTQFDNVAWDTTGLDNKALSHISFWEANGNSNNQVPEPATIALVGFGLAAVAGYRRKRHSS
jgi:hypothetical protein